MGIRNFPQIRKICVPQFWSFVQYLIEALLVIVWQISGIFEVKMDLRCIENVLSYFDC